MGGKHMISISAAVRKDTALAADPVAGAFFAKLSNSLQRYHAGNINAAKAADTRQRRIHKALSLFREGKQR